MRKGRVGVGRQVLTKKDKKVGLGRFGNAKVGPGLKSYQYQMYSFENDPQSKLSSLHDHA